MTSPPPSSPPKPPPPKPDRELTPERLRELAAAGAPPVSTAFAQFVGRTLFPGAPTLAAASAPARPGGWERGIFFEMEGDLSGCVALMLSPETCQSLGAVGQLDPPDGSEASVMLELANIVASRSLSTIADATAGRIMISLPSVVVEHAERELAWRAERLGAGAVRVELEYADPAGELRALLVVLAAWEAPSAP